MSETPFVPTKISVGDDYRKDDLSNAYADAVELGLWVREFGGGKTHMCGVGSIYTVQHLEYLNPGVEIDPWTEFTLGDCVELGVPGSGATRTEAVHDGIRAFKESSLWAKHLEWHELAVEEKS